MKYNPQKSVVKERKSIPLPTYERSPAPHGLPERSTKAGEVTPEIRHDLGRKAPASRLAELIAGSPALRYW